MTVFFTSDHHFGHANIINYCTRPFNTVEEMDEALTQSWNEAVNDDDIIFHLGDFTLGDLSQATHYFQALNGMVFFLSNPWHHDRRWLDEIRPYNHPATKDGSTVAYLPGLYVCDKYGGFPDDVWAVARHPITLCHYPLAVWDRKHYAAWHFHGHSHGGHRGTGMILDVGVDSAYEKLGEYRPFSLEEAREFLND
jgi:calcineurin-like phosphoesterase family protein